MESEIVIQPSRWVQRSEHSDPPRCVISARFQLDFQTVESNAPRVQLPAECRSRSRRREAGTSKTALAGSGRLGGFRRLEHFGPLASRQICGGICWGSRTSNPGRRSCRCKMVLMLAAPLLPGPGHWLLVPVAARPHAGLSRPALVFGGATLPSSTAVIDSLSPCENVHSCRPCPFQRRHDCYDCRRFAVPNSDLPAAFGGTVNRVHGYATVE